MKDNLISGYYFITDSGLSLAGNLTDARDAQKAGVSFIQYREKNKSSLEMFNEALKLRSICRNSRLLINDRIDVALAVNADGIHLGQEDLPVSIARRILGRKKIIGVSVSSLPQALKARDSGADYIGVGPIFPTSTKKDAKNPLGLGIISLIKKKVKLPIVAIGGINLDNAPLVVQAGADALCAISFVVANKNPAAQIERFQRLFRKE